MFDELLEDRGGGGGVNNELKPIKGGPRVNEIIMMLEDNLI